MRLNIGFRAGAFVFMVVAALMSRPLTARPAAFDDCGDPNCPSTGRCLVNYGDCPSGYSWVADISCSGIFYTVCKVSG
jgi:hypothetical protein